LATISIVTALVSQNCNYHRFQNRTAVSCLTRIGSRSIMIFRFPPTRLGKICSIYPMWPQAIERHIERVHNSVRLSALILVEIRKMDSKKGGQPEDWMDMGTGRVLLLWPSMHWGQVDRMQWKT